MKTGETIVKQNGGLQLVQRSAAHVGAVAELREGSTGRAVSTVPRIWAVASVSAPVAEPVDVKGRKEAPKPELAFYRKYTEAMLRRYLKMSMETGRVPSLLGREMFRGHVTSYRVRSFEDSVIFCVDVEACLRRLSEQERQLIKRIALQEYTQGEAASMLGMSLRSCVRKYAEAVDRLTAIFLEVQLLEPLGGLSRG